MIWTGKTCARAASDATGAPATDARVGSRRGTSTLMICAGGPSILPWARRRSSPWRIRRSVLRVLNDLPRPRRYIPSRSDVFPEAFSPRMRLLPAARVRSARSIQRRFSSASSASGIARPSLQAHRHDDVLGIRRTRGANQAAAIGIGQTDLDAIGVDRAQSVQQVVDIEPDLAIFPLVVYLDLILRLFLLRVLGLDRHEVGFHRHTHAAVLFIRQNGRALQRLAQDLAIRVDDLGRRCRNYTAVLRETTIYQLRSEANIADLRANVVRADGKLDL